MKIREKKIEELKKIKKLLIVIDMVNGFVKEGALASPSIQRILPENKRLVEKFIEGEDTAVAFIRDSHTKDAVEFNVFGAHCLEGTIESELEDTLKPFESDALVYKKNSTNFVFAPSFQEDIASMENLEEVVLNGCLSDYCVKNGGITLRNLFDQQDRNIKIYVEEDGIDTFDAPNHNREEETEHAFRDMANNGLIRIKKYEVR